jgi:hypothetical protein
MFLTGRTFFGHTRRLVGSCGEMLIATSATSAFRHNKTIFSAYHISYHQTGFGIFYHGSGWDFNFDICTTRAAHIFSTTGFTVFSLKVDTALKRRQRIQAGIDFDDYIAAPAPIATRWPATRHEFFTQEGNDTIATITATDINLDII